MLAKEYTNNPSFRDFTYRREADRIIIDHFVFDYDGKPLLAIFNDTLFEVDAFNPGYGKTFFVLQTESLFEVVNRYGQVCFSMVIDFDNSLLIQGAFFKNYNPENANPGERPSMAVLGLKNNTSIAIGEPPGNIVDLHRELGVRKLFLWNDIFQPLPNLNQNPSLNDKRPF